MYFDSNYDRWQYSFSCWCLYNCIPRCNEHVCLQEFKLSLAEFGLLAPGLTIDDIKTANTPEGVIVESAVNKDHVDIVLSGFVVADVLDSVRLVEEIMDTKRRQLLLQDNGISDSMMTERHASLIH